MRRSTVLLSALLLAGAALRPLAAQSLLPVPLSVEIRGGAGIPTGELSEGDPGVGAESGPMVGGALAVHVTPRLALVGGYSRTRFDCPRCAQQGLDGTVVGQGGDFALQLTPGAIRGLAPWVRAGGLFHQLTFTGAGGELSSDPAPGFQVGAGLGFSLLGALRLTPGVHYRSYPAELELGGWGTSRSGFPTFSWTWDCRIAFEPPSGGEGRMRSWTLGTLLLALLAGCQDGPSSPQLQTAVAGLFRPGARLQVAEVLTVTGGEAQAIFLDGGADGSEYLLVPFNASDSSAKNLVVEVTGGNVRPPSGTVNPALLALRAPEPDQAFHQRLREREIAELTPLFPAARELRARGALRPSRGAQAVPSVGDTLTLNASREACRSPDPRRARVAAVTERAIVVEDLANPPGGFSPEEFRSVGVTFDTLIYPVDTRNFGVPTDIDNNNRVIIFYTRVVNELTEPNSSSFVGGFFFGRDLFPRSACATSNVGEIFYLLAPDPTGAVNGNVRSREFVLRRTLGTVAHEFQHLINAARRLYVNNAPRFEEVWLNEGLSHIAEELQFYAITPLEPRQNIDERTLRSSAQIIQAFNTYQISNFGRYQSYLQNPDEESLLGIDNLPTRGASWAFLRYTADQEPGPDSTFFFRLVNGPATGVQNLSAVLGTNAIDFMQTWTVSVFTDDAVPGVAPRFQQPSWNFRSIVPLLGQGGFPLEIIPLSGTQTALTLKGGGAAFLRFGIAPGQRAAISVLSGGAIPPDRLRVSVVRLK